MSKKKMAAKKAAGEIPTGTRGLIHERPKDLKRTIQHRVLMWQVGEVNSKRI